MPYKRYIYVGSGPMENEEWALVDATCANCVFMMEVKVNGRQFTACLVNPPQSGQPMPETQSWRYCSKWQHETEEAGLYRPVVEDGAKVGLLEFGDGKD